jgi:hypothetical protein
MEELVSPGNAPFLVAICMMVFIGALEGLSLLIGTGLLHHLDSFFAIHLDHAHFDHAGPLFPGENVLGWLHVGRVPLLVLIVLFLMGFAIAGLTLQWAVAGLVGNPLPPLPASLIAAACAVPGVRLFGGQIARYVPRDETSAISEESFVGRVARLTAASAMAGQPGQAKLTDEHGRTHYLLVVPDDPEIQFTRDDAVLIVSRASGSLFHAIRNPRPDLL